MFMLKAFAGLTTPSARTKVASRYFLDRAATPPLRGGEWRSIPIHSPPPMTAQDFRCKADHVRVYAILAEAHPRASPEKTPSPLPYSRAPARLRRGSLRQ